MSIKFDLKAALAGAPVQNGTGQAVKGLHLFDTGRADDYPLHGVVNGTVHCWTTDGIHSRWTRSSGLDLQMVPSKAKAVANIYKYRGADHIYRVDVHDSEQAAQAGARSGYGQIDQDLFARVTIEVTEGQGLTEEELKALHEA